MITIKIRVIDDMLRIAISTLSIVAILCGCSAGGLDSNSADDLNPRPIRTVIAKVLLSDSVATSISPRKNASELVCGNILKPVVIDVESLQMFEASIATNDTDGSCIVSLPLEVGKPYSIVFVDSGGCYIATLFSPNGSIMMIPDEGSEINLGVILVSRGKAQFPLYVYCSIPPGQWQQSCEGDQECTYDPCSIYYSCADFDLQGPDENNLCGFLGSSVSSDRCSS